MYKMYKKNIHLIKFFSELYYNGIFIIKMLEMELKKLREGDKRFRKFLG